MEPIIMLPYSELEVCISLAKIFKKKEGYSICVPTSRQQKGIDLLIYNIESSKTISIQVKSSRTYVHEENDVRYRYNLWFNNFRKSYRPGISDFYMLFGLYQKYDPKHKISSKDKFWSSILLCFTDKEMGKLLSSIRTKTTNKPDQFFSIGFDSIDAIYGSRGFSKEVKLNKKLLNARIGIMKRKLL